MTSTDLILGVSKKFSALIRTADQYARSDWPILLLGETGVGKELIAQRIHRTSGRRLLPFLPVNCGAMPPALFESELFGFEKGAFSGAVQSARGLLRTAHGGSLFLDEIGELDLSLQVKLLRVLDSGEVRAVGSPRLNHADVRIIAATNVDVYGAVGRGEFRRDLLERLSVLTLQIPPLRERKEDIVELATYWLKQFQTDFSPPIFDILVSYEWPGNIRELRNILARASVLGQGTVTPPLLQRILNEERSLTSTMVSVDSQDLSKRSLEEIEKQFIVERLKRCQGNRKKAAQELGIAKSTLHEKLRRWKKESGDEIRWPVARWDSIITLNP